MPYKYVGPVGWRLPIRRVLGELGHYDHVNMFLGVDKNKLDDDFPRIMFGVKAFMP